MRDFRKTYREIIQRAIDRDELDILSPKAKELYKAGVAVNIFKKPMLSAPVMVPTPPRINPKTGEILEPKGSSAYDKVVKGVEADPRKSVYQKSTYLGKGIYAEGPEYIIPDSDVRSEYDPTARKITRTRKKGWLGDLIGHDGRVIRDYSWISDLKINGISQTIPLVIPGMKRKNVDWLLSGKPPTEEIIKDATEFAKKRLLNGMSPFKGGAGASKLTPIQSYTELKIAEKSNKEVSTNKVAALLRGLGEGVTVELPRMTGQALKFLGAETAGNILTEWSERQADNLWGSKPEYDEFTRWFYEAGKIIPTSAIPGGVSLTGARILLMIGLRAERVRKSLKSLHKLKKAYETKKLGATDAAQKALRAALKDPKGAWKTTGAAVKAARKDLRKAQILVNRATAGSVGGLFGLSTAQHTKEITWDRIHMLEEQGDFEGANALRRTLSWAPFLTGLIEGTGEYFGTKYLAKLFMVSRAEIGAKTTTGWLTDIILNMGRVAGVEMGTEAAQQAGIATTEKLTGIRPEAEILAEVISVLGPAAVAAFLFGGASGVGNYPRARKSIERYQEEQKQKADTKKWALLIEADKAKMNFFRNMETEQLAGELERRGINTGNWVDYISEVIQGIPEEEAEQHIRGYMVWALGKLDGQLVSNETELAEEIVRTEAEKTEGTTEVSFLDYLDLELELLLAKQHGISITDKDGKAREDTDIRKDLIKFYKNAFPDAGSINEETGEGTEMDDSTTDELGITNSDEVTNNTYRTEDGYTLKDDDGNAIELFNEQQHLRRDNPHPEDKKNSWIDLQKIAEYLNIQDYKHLDEAGLIDRIFMEGLIGKKRYRRAKKVIEKLRSIREDFRVKSGNSYDFKSDDIRAHYVKNPREFERDIKTLIDKKKLLLNISNGRIHVTLYQGNPSITTETMRGDRVGYALKIMQIRREIGERMKLDAPGFLHLQSALYLLEKNNIIDNWEDWKIEIEKVEGDLIAEGVSPYVENQHAGRSVNMNIIHNSITNKAAVEIANKILETSVKPISMKRKWPTPAARKQRDNYPGWGKDLVDQLEKLWTIKYKDSKSAGDGFTSLMTKFHRFLDEKEEHKAVILDEYNNIKKGVTSMDFYPVLWDFIDYLRVEISNVGGPVGELMKFLHGAESTFPTLASMKQGEPMKNHIYQVKVKKIEDQPDPEAMRILSDDLIAEVNRLGKKYNRTKKLSDLHELYFAARDFIRDVIFAQTGMRTGELNPLEWGSIGIDKHGVVTFVKPSSKTREGRETPGFVLSPNTFAKALEVYKEVYSMLLKKDRKLVKAIKASGLAGVDKVYGEKDGHLRKAPAMLWIDFKTKNGRFDKLIIIEGTKRKAVKADWFLGELNITSYSTDKALQRFREGYKKALKSLKRKATTKKEKIRIQKLIDNADKVVQHAYRHVWSRNAYMGKDITEENIKKRGGWTSEVSEQYSVPQSQLRDILRKTRRGWEESRENQKIDRKLLDPIDEKKVLGGKNRWLFYDVSMFGDKYISLDLSEWRGEDTYVGKKKGKYIFVHFDEHNNVYEVPVDELSEVTAFADRYIDIFEKVAGKKLQVKPATKTNKTGKPAANTKKPQKNTVRKVQKGVKADQEILKAKAVSLGMAVKLLSDAIRSNGKIKGRAKDQPELVDNIINTFSSIFKKFMGSKQSQAALLDSAEFAITTSLSNASHKITKENKNKLEEFINSLNNQHIKTLKHIRTSQDIVRGDSWNAEIFAIVLPRLYAIGDRLGLKNYEIIGNFEDMPESLDLDTEYGRRVLSEAGLTREEIENARQNKEEYYEDGTYQAIFDEKNPNGRAVITLRHGANFTTAIHELIHLYIQQGGKVKGVTDRLTRGIAANEEWIARELSEILIKDMKKNGGVLRISDKFKEAAGVFDKDLYTRTLHNHIFSHVVKAKAFSKNAINKIQSYMGKANVPFITPEQRGLADTFDSIVTVRSEDIEEVGMAAEEKDRREAKTGVSAGEVQGLMSPVTKVLRNTDVISKFRNWPAVSKIIEFLTPVKVLTKGNLVLMLRHMKDGKIAKGLDFIDKNLMVKLKNVPKEFVVTFFEYTNGLHNDVVIGSNMRSMETKRSHYDNLFNIKEEHERKIRELEVKIESIKKNLKRAEEEGVKRETNKYVDMESKITISERAIEERRGRIKDLGLESIEIFEETEQNKALVLENKTKEEVNNMFDKIMVALERMYWEDDKMALKKAVDAGLPTELSKLAKQAKVLQLEMGKHLYKIGLINRETFWKFYGTYIHYMYLRNLVGWNNSDMRELLPEQAVPGVYSGILEQRENKTLLERTQIAQLKDINLVIPYGVGKTLQLLANANYLDMLSRPETQAIIPFKDIPNVVKKKKGYVLEQEMTALELRTLVKYVEREKDRTSWVIMAKEEQRVKSWLIDEIDGEIKQMERVIHKLDTSPPAGYSKEDRVIIQKYVDRLKALYAPVEAHLTKNNKKLGDYIRIGENYGKISHEYLARGIYEDMMPLLSDSPSQRERLYNELMRWNATATMVFKAGKVAVNPPTVFRNLVSNFLQNNMRGRPLPHVLLDFMSAVKSMATGDKWWQEARDIGVFKGQMMETEAKEVLDHLEKTGAHKNWFKFMTWLTKQTKYYGKIDELAKLSIYKQLRTKGSLNRFGFATGKKVNKYEAAMIAVKWGMDYSLASTSIKKLRKQLIPFVTYQYKILPLILDSLAHRPWVLGKWAGFLGVSSLGVQGIAHALSQSLLGIDDDEWERMLKQLPDFITENNTFIPLPWKSRDGKVMWFDGLYFMPFGTWLSTLKGLSKGEAAEVFKEMGVGNPFLTVFQAINSATRDKPAIDPFTKQPIYNMIDTPAERYHKILSWMQNVVAPGWLENITIPSAPKQGPLGMSRAHIYNWIRGTQYRDKWGRIMGWEQHLRWFGINPYIFSARQTWAIRKAKEAYLQKQFKEKTRTLHPYKDRGKIMKYKKRYNKMLNEIRGQDVGALSTASSRWF